jgi:hypothetical protein
LSCASDVRVKTTNVADFTDHLLTEKKDFPVVEGELNFVFPGCYTTQVEMKGHNRQAEHIVFSMGCTPSMCNRNLADLRAFKGVCSICRHNPNLATLRLFTPRSVWQPSFSPLPNLMISEPIPAFLHFKNC